MRKSNLKFTWTFRLRNFKIVKTWRWTLTASNGRIRANSGEDFYNHQDCINNAKKTGRDLIELTKDL